jgi:transposase
MPKSHPPYTAEFKRRMVELVRSGRTPEDLARQFEPSAQAIRNWAQQADRDQGVRADGLTTEEREELRVWSLRTTRGGSVCRCSASGNPPTDR